MVNSNCLQTYKLMSFEQSEMNARFSGHWEVDNCEYNQRMRQKEESSRWGTLNGKCVHNRCILGCHEARQLKYNNWRRIHRSTRWFIWEEPFPYWDRSGKFLDESSSKVLCGRTAHRGTGQLDAAHWLWHLGSQGLASHSFVICSSWTIHYLHMQFCLSRYSCSLCILLQLCAMSCPPVVGAQLAKPISAINANIMSTVALAYFVKFRVVLCYSDCWSLNRLDISRSFFFLLGGFHAPVAFPIDF